MFFICITCLENPFEHLSWNDKVDFSKNHTPEKPKSNLGVKKSFFQKRVRLHFLPVKYFLCIFKASYAYEKHRLESKESFDIICGTTRRIQVDSREEKVNFVDFSKMTLHQSQNPIWVSKKAFLRSAWGFIFCP